MNLQELSNGNLHKILVLVNLLTSAAIMGWSKQAGRQRRLEKYCKSGASRINGKPRYRLSPLTSFEKCYIIQNRTFRTYNLASHDNIISDRIFDNFFPFTHGCYIMKDKMSLPYLYVPLVKILHDKKAFQFSTEICCIMQVRMSLPYLSLVKILLNKKSFPVYNETC